jgi:oligoribonuclease NrnB/cAMP/cGMP phosphodiesterase (DHH superfamily)
VVHITDSDLDGISCTILAHHYIEPLCKKFTPICTGERDMSEVPEDVFESDIDIVLFTDIAPTLELVKTLQEHSKKIIIVDHHETSKNILDELNIPNYYYSEDSCGAMLLYDLIIGDSRRKRVVDRFIHLVNVYDTWKDTHDDWENAKDLHYLKNASTDWFCSMGDSDYFKNIFFIEKTLDKFGNKEKFFFTYDELKKIKKERLGEKKSYIHAKKKLERRVDSRGNTYIYIECPNKVSIVGNILLKEYDVDYALCRSTYKDAVELMSFSLRSAKGMNIREIAELYGGGGHESASGFKAKDKQEYEDLISGSKTPI